MVTNNFSESQNVETSGKIFFSRTTKRVEEQISNYKGPAFDRKNLHQGVARDKRLISG